MENNGMENNGMENNVTAALITVLLKARDTAHMFHWKTRSFSQHVALGELYEGLLDLADSYFEMYMGKYGTDSHIDLGSANPFSEQDPMEFMRDLVGCLNSFETMVVQDGFLVNKFQEIQELVSRTMYKMENLK